MTGVRVLVGTRKGAFVLTSDERRELAGQRPALRRLGDLPRGGRRPTRTGSTRRSPVAGSARSSSAPTTAGRRWEPVGNEFRYDGVPGTHQWYDGTPQPWEFARVWHLEPSLTDPDTVYAGVEDAALFRSTDGGQTWQELAGLRGPRVRARRWQPGAGGMCLHTIILDPSNPERMFVAISAAGVFRTDDGGQTWRPINRGLQSEGIPDPDAEVGHCVHHLAMHPARPDVLFMQKHWDVMRSDDAGESWREISGDLPTDFGFPIDVHAHEPETVYVVPITSDSEHFPPDGRLRVYRSRTGGDEWEPLTERAAAEQLLRQRAARRHGGGLARTRAACTSAPPAARCTPRPTPATAGRRSCATCRRCCRSRCRRCHDPGRAAGSPAHAGPGRAARSRSQVDGPATQRAVLDALEARYPMLRGTLPRPRAPASAGRSCGSSPARRTCRTSRRTPRCPDAVAHGTEPFLVVGAMAGG